MLFFIFHSFKYDITGNKKDISLLFIVKEIKRMKI